MCKQPFFTIIIPTYNRPDELKNCLDAITRLEYPRNCFEVIIVNDGGGTTAESVVGSFVNGLNLSLITQLNSGPSEARNRGASNAKGEFLAFIDDDCLPARDWLKTLAAHFTNKPNCLIGGHTINLLTNNIYSTMSQLIVEIAYGHYNSDPNKPRFFASNNIALPKDLFYKIGGFDKSFATSEDRDFCNRCLYNGFQMFYVPNALVYHVHELKFHTFCKQHFNYGRGAFRFHLKKVGKGSDSFFHHFRFHLNLRNWLVYPFTQVKGVQISGISFLLIIWQVVNAAGFFWEAGKHGIRKLMRIRD